MGIYDILSTRMRRTEKYVELEAEDLKKIGAKCIILGTKKRPSGRFLVEARHQIG